MRKRRFDWDKGNRDKCANRVPIAEIEALFDGRPLKVKGDPHQFEARHRAWGYNDEGRGVFVVFTYRFVDGELCIRPISVHYIHRDETNDDKKQNREQIGDGENGEPTEDGNGEKETLPDVSE